MKTIVLKKVADLIPYHNNPRNNENAINKVASSISSYGFQNPILIDKDNVIICGHTRLLAAQKLGLEQVPCIIAEDLTPAQVKAFRLIDNKTSEFATWEYDKLNIELDELKELDMDLEEFGFDISNFNPYEPENKEKEIDELETENECPQCGYKW